MTNTSDFCLTFILVYHLLKKSGNKQIDRDIAFYMPFYMSFSCDQAHG